MSRFNDGDFFSPDDEEQHSEFEHEYDEDDHDEVEHDPDSFLSAIPAGLVNQWKQSEISIEEKKLDYVILRQAISLCEKSFLWRFRRFSKKVRMINAMYFAMADLVKGEE